MNDVKDMLAAALDRGPDPGQPVNPTGDLARGRRLLRRRRLTRLAGAAGGAAVAAGIVAAVLTLGPAGQGAPHQPPAAGQHTRHQHAPPAPGHHPARRAIKLVSYQGYQAPGYQVSEVPRGWVVQGANAFALTVAPAGDPDKSVDSFTGKIAVMLKSRDEPAPKGQPNLPVAGRPGFLGRQGGTWILLYQNPSGPWVDIQFPAKLGWDAPQFARFAAGVKVLGNAQPGRG
jgi:hypothetical protein